MSTAANRIPSKTYNPCGGDEAPYKKWAPPPVSARSADGDNLAAWRGGGDENRKRFNGRDGGSGGRLLRSVDTAGGPQLPDLGPAVPAPVHPRPWADQEGGSADQWRTPSSVTARSEEHTSELQSRENLVCR